jgi:hypothetical protein
MEISEQACTDAMNNSLEVVFENAVNLSRLLCKKGEKK